MTRNAVKKWMWLRVEDFVDDCGEVQCAAMAETAAWEVGSDSWLDDPDHFVWDLAVDVAEEYERRK